MGVEVPDTTEENAGGKWRTYLVVARVVAIRRCWEAVTLGMAEIMVDAEVDIEGQLEPQRLRVDRIGSRWDYVSGLGLTARGRWINAELGGRLRHA